VSPWPSGCGPKANTPKSGEATAFVTAAGIGVQVWPSKE
jgi:hypothetical protein